MQAQHVAMTKKVGDADLCKRFTLPVNDRVSLAVGTIALTDDYGRFLLSGIAPVTLKHAAQKVLVNGSKVLEGLMKLAEAVEGPGMLHITGESYRSIPAGDIAAFREKYPNKKINIIETD